jgi:hypothetical protein
MKSESTREQPVVADNGMENLPANFRIELMRANDLKRTGPLPESRDLWLS